ncbi:DUF6517 family protein [Natronorubrum aibiense]|uniref:Uncharacterized protein n=1 Tax=Natronorubrum aibiense TaxID=348826 RepID=A0A5P9P2F8_9EURY|nr:DUF6517 family protein [Natronorubrum aibiense]QFU82216.1 hypothetical protein GCU68_06570 [Natronorubrum aibiense]
MNLSRRQLLAAGACAGLGLGAGCTDVVRDTLDASPATVARAALEETGYSEHAVEEVVLERTVDRFGLERSIEVRNWNARYDRSLDLEVLGLGQLQTAVFAVLATPQVSILGRTLNPVGDYSTDELVALIQERYDELQNVEYADEESVSVLGTDTTLARYRGQARLAPAATTLDIYVQVTEAVEHGNDFVVCVAVYPQLQGYELESPSVRTMLADLEHP